MHFTICRCWIPIIIFANPISLVFLVTVSPPISVQNLVDLGFLKIKADAFCEPSGSNRTLVDIREVVFEIAGLLQIPVKVRPLGLWMSGLPGTASLVCAVHCQQLIRQISFDKCV